VLLVGPHAFPTPVKPGKSRQIAANENAENLDRVERLLMVVLHADLQKVAAARKLRAGWEVTRKRLYEARVRLPNRAFSAKMIARPPRITPTM
jgi:hypothetical protein